MEMPMYNPIVEDMWTPFKHLYSVLQQTLSNPNGPTTDLELCTKKYKQCFTNFLRNPPKNEKSRTHLRTALAEGIPLAGSTRRVQISHDLIDEALILSDMFDLDEVFALELLCTATRQQMHHPGLPRGLVAILLYYDGRKAMSCTLRDMFQAVSGVSWSTELPRELTLLINSYSQNLVEDSNILGRLLELLDELDVNKESILLTKNRAFGSKKHQNQVLALFEDIRRACAMALFNWSAQRGLPKAIAVRLLRQLSLSKPNDATGHMDDVTAIMLAALMSSYDTSVLLLTETNNPHASHLPILSDPEFAKQFLETLYSQQLNWQPLRLDAIIKYSFGLTLASLRHTSASLQAAAAPFINRDEQLIDEALATNVFGFFYRQLLEKEVVFKNEFIFRRVHMLITDFIDFMHAKVTEMRGRADETARTVISFLNEGLEPPANLDCNFELLMLCVAKFYGDSRAPINLGDEYWGPTEPNGSPAPISSYAKNTSRAVSLFKFISLASELLPQTLFRAYLKMISGLTRSEFSARCAYNLLKHATRMSASAYAVTWDHFFSALGNYYSNMRNEFNLNIGGAAGMGDTIYRSRNLPRNMTQRETEHLVAVMGIMQAVAEHDEISRIMLCDNAGWQAPQVLLGLVACSTPLILKAEILFTLASIAKSKDTARTIWFHLEDSQIIPTIPVTCTFSQCCLAEEIEQNECRLESYKLTRGILALLHTLMTTNMPASLGAGPRKPGYDAYLTFVFDSILLKFYNRAYKDPAEKWQVGAQCLKLLYFLLATYRPSSADFQEQREEHPHPGYHIMLQLQVKSDVLQLILRLIEEARERLDDYNNFRGKDALEECALYAMLLLEVALAKQNTFFEAHAAANCPILLSGLNRMLLDLNPRSRRPDYVLNITKFVTYNSWLPRHTLAAINILRAVTTLPNVSCQILNMYAQGANEKMEIRQGFVECLEADWGVHGHLEESLNQLTFITEDFAGGYEKENSGRLDLAKLEERKRPRIELQIKEAIIDLFLQNLNQQLPNFVYFLLGIDVIKDFMANERQQLGIKMTCSCVNSLVLILERHFERQPETFCEQTAHIIERIYHLFYGLCANRRTSETVLRYFRLTCNDFLLRHLSAMPFRFPHKDEVLKAMSHVIKCVTIEMKLAATHGQSTRYHLLVDILLGSGAENQRSTHTLPLEINGNMVTTTPPPHSINFFGKDMMAGAVFKPPQDVTAGLHVNRLLDSLVLEEAQTVSQPRLEFFDSQLINQLLQDCESPTNSRGNGLPASLINIRKMHDVLQYELCLVQSTIASGQRKAIIGEITALLQHAIRMNSVRTHRFATFDFMEAWCHLVQILFSSMPEAVMPPGVRQQHMIEIIEKIFIKVKPLQPLIEISVQVTEAVLILMANLRLCCCLLEDQRSVDEQGKVIYRGDLPGDANKTRSSASHSNLRFILKHLVEWIMVSEVKSQKLRINLYTALLNCLRIVKRLRRDELQEYNETFIYRLDSSTTYHSSNTFEDTIHKEMASEVIGAFGEKLIETICHDAVTGHDVCRMLALSCLDIISEVHATSSFSEFISVHGYLKHLLDSLAKSNESLCSILQPRPEHMRALYVYESRMAFFTRLAHTPIGAGLLLSERALGVLSNMSVYDMQPDLKASVLKRHEPNSFIPSIDERFLSILLPALSLCDAIVNSMGSRNNSAALQILNFLFSHIEMIESLLRTATPLMELGYLKQLAIITNLLARTTTHDVATLEDSLDLDHDLELRNRLNRLQQLMIMVYSRFTVSETNIRHMLMQNDHVQQEAQTEAEKNLHIKYYLDTAANLSLYCRNAVTSHARDSMTSKYLLTTMINDVTPLTGKTDSKKLTAIMHTILNHLKGSIGYYLSQKSMADSLLQQRDSLPNISFGPGGKQSFIELSQRHNEKRSELTQTVFIAEQNLYLLWIHLDFYLRNAVIYTQENRNAINESNLDPMNMSVLNASVDEITQLKQTLISTFNETFCTQLITASECYTSKCKGFNASLLRRIKALVQFAPVN